MSDQLLHQRLDALADAVARTADPAVLGVVRRIADTVTMSYRYVAGTGGQRMPAGNILDVFLPGTQQARQIALADVADSPCPIRSFMSFGGARRVVAVPAEGAAHPTLLCVGTTRAEALTSDEIRALEPIAAEAASLLDTADPDPIQLDRLRQMERVAHLFPALFDVLDVRDVFDRVSAISRDIVPHDLLLLGVFSDDYSQIALYAHSGAVNSPPTINPSRYALPLITAWDYHIITDMQERYEYEEDPISQNGRASLRVPVRFAGRIVAGLSFISQEAAKYSFADVSVARRIADFLALALSHQRLAEESRRNAELRARAANIDTLDELLKTLVGVLDIRDVFDRVSQIAGNVLPHDALIIREMTDDPKVARNYALSGLGGLPVPKESPVTEPHLLIEDWDQYIIENLATHPHYAASPLVAIGLRSLLSLPVRLERRLVATVNFVSRTIGRFTHDDVIIGRRIADHIALAMSHQRLANEQRQADELRTRAAELQLLDELLTSIISGGALPDVFARLSSVAEKVLPHDALVLTALLPDGERAAVYASKTPEGVPFPSVVEVPPLMLEDRKWEYDLADDLSQDPRQRNLTAGRLGYRSALRVPIRLDGEYVAGVSFLSFAPSRYRREDIPIAQRIAERMSLNFLRERGAQQSKRADEATARAAKLEARVRALTEELDARTGYRRVLGQSAPWREVLKQATQVAATDTTALLLGESGTGKEVIARFLHRASTRNHGPFIALNCAALPEHLLEAELFGYERGAFTGAVQSKPGQLEQAAGGTLFLDEVAEMTPQAQAKFLRVLQEREFTRLGGTRVLRTDARVVAATNRDLLRAMERGQFREDLYYRLNVFAILLPPLRDRRDDVLPLSEAFLTEFGRSLGRPPGGISRDAREALLGYHWPGNVRELRNVLERAAILCDGGLVAAEHLALRPTASSVIPRTEPVTASVMPPPPAPIPPPAAEQPAPLAPPARASTDLMAAERALIDKALKDSRFNKSQAAKLLGLSRAQLYVRLRKHGLE